MSTTPKGPKASVLPPNRHRISRFQSFLERATAHFAHKPEHVYAVRQGKTRPIHERQLAENMALIAQGYRASEIIAALETMIIEIEDATAVESAQRGAFLSIAEEYRRVMAAEGAAHEAQYRATETGDVSDIDRALEVVAFEIAAEKAHWRALKRRRDTVALLRNHMGPARPIGKAS